MHLKQNKTQEKVYLSIVIPCYNEEKNLKRKILEKVAEFLKTQEFSWEGIIVDDGSTDKSVDLIEEFIKKNPRFSLIKNPHQGKAATVITGMLKAKGRYVLFTDFDQATPIAEIEKFLPWFEKGYDVIIGSRKRKREGAPLLRRIMALGFIFLRTLILGLGGISDTQCGFKAFKNEVAKKIFTRLRLYGERKKVSGSMVTAGFDIETLFLAKKMNFKIKEIEVEWHFVETRRVNPIRDSWLGFLDLLKIKWASLRGFYDN